MRQTIDSFNACGHALMLQPITLSEAFIFVEHWHRHLKAPQGGLFAVGCSMNNEVVGVAIVGRPVARMLDNGWTAEVTRLCVKEDHPHVCSLLYAACWRACRALGYKRLITYILHREKGTSLVAAGWKLIGEAGGGTWNREDRPRVDKFSLERKKLWEQRA